MGDRRDTARDRRSFIIGTGAALLAIQCLPSLAHTSEGLPLGGAAGSLIIRSGSGFVPHTHDLLIPYAILRTPPSQGVKLVSTSSFLHTHEVALTQAQLIAVSRGGTVAVPGGSHTFVIALARAIRH